MRFFPPVAFGGAHAPRSFPDSRPPRTRSRRRRSPSVPGLQAQRLHPGPGRGAGNGDRRILHPPVALHPRRRAPQERPLQGQVDLVKVPGSHRRPDRIHASSKRPRIRDRAVQGPLQPRDGDVERRPRPDQPLPDRQQAVARAWTSAAEAATSARSSSARPRSSNIRSACSTAPAPTRPTPTTTRTWPAGWSSIPPASSRSAHRSTTEATPLRPARPASSGTASGWTWPSSAAPSRSRPTSSRRRTARLLRRGWYVQGGYVFLPKALQGVVKFDSYDPDATSAVDRLDTWTVGLNWFLAERTKLQVNYELIRNESGNDDQPEPCSSSSR